MSLKGLLYIGLFGLCAVGALFLPQLGIYGYIADYCINPSGQWWGAPFSAMGLRGPSPWLRRDLLGMILHFNRLKYGRSSCRAVAAGVSCRHLGPVLYQSQDRGPLYHDGSPVVKMTKIFVFVLMIVACAHGYQEIERPVLGPVERVHSQG